MAGLAIRIETEMGVTDAFRWLHPQERAYTRGTRQIDRIAIPTEWTTTSTPCISEARHIEREEVELVLAKSKGEWRVKRPDHKAVEIRVRYTNERRAAAEWKHAGTYPKEIQEEVRKIIKDTLTDERINTEEAKMGLWQKKVKDRLVKHEKDAKKEHQRKRQGLRAARDIWLARAREAPGNTKAISIAARFQSKMDRGKIEREKKKADMYREREWAKATRNTKSLFAKLKEQIMQTDITALGKEETESTPARGAAQTAEEHMERCFNVHKINDAGRSEEAKDERKVATKEICDTVREHIRGKSAAKRRRVGKLSVGDMFSVGNVAKAIRAVRTGVVLGPQAPLTAGATPDGDVGAPKTVTISDASPGSVSEGEGEQAGRSVRSGVCESEYSLVEAGDGAPTPSQEVGRRDSESTE